MFLEDPSQTLDVSFKVKHGDSYYTVYVNTCSLRCFQSGDLGYKIYACPQQATDTGAQPSTSRVGTTVIGGSVGQSTEEPCPPPVKVADWEAAAAVPVASAVDSVVVFGGGFGGDGASG